MKHAIAIATLFVSPAAFAQERDPSCALYDQLIAAAPDGMAAYRGEAVSELPGVHRSTLSPSGIGTCMIISGSEASMICYSPRLTEKGAEFRYTREMLRMVTCLKGWEAKPPVEFEAPPPPPGQPGLVSERGVRFMQKRGDLEITFGLAEAREDTPEPSARIVGFGFHWKPAPLGV